MILFLNYFNLILLNCILSITLYYKIKILIFNEYKFFLMVFKKNF
jgi:hypothetical protein